jgi:hypothetical protein
MPPLFFSAFVHLALQHAEKQTSSENHHESINPTAYLEGNFPRIALDIELTA